MNNKESHDTGWCAWGKKKIEPRDTGVSDEIETPKTGLRLVKYRGYLRSIATLRPCKQTKPLLAVQDHLLFNGCR